MSQPPDSTLCYNCGAPLAGAFCAACGQKAQPLNVTLHDLLHDTTHQIFDVDGRIFRSVRKLLFSPGYLTAEHFRGRRARWTAPLRLYLVFSVIYFAVASFSNAEVRVTGSAEEADESLKSLGFQSEQQLQEAISDAQRRWMPRVMFVLVPFFGWLVYVGFRRMGRNYPQHLYFALHVHAAWFAAAALAAAVALVPVPLIGDVVDVLAVAYGLVYLVLAVRTAYGVPLRAAVLRSAAFAGVYWLVTIGAVLAIVLPVLFGRR